MKSFNQYIDLPFGNVQLVIKREDLLHPTMSGNKYRKLKYNLDQASAQGFSRLLTFGGAFSNHICAVASAGKEFGFETIGIIRGDELQGRALNTTLEQAAQRGMRLKFVSRDAYRRKDRPEFINSLQSEFGPFYLLPEGGTNPLAVRGCEEILSEEDFSFDYICCAVGTGGTISGVVNSSQPHQMVIGYPALKESFLEKDIRLFAKQNNWSINRNYHFGGYGKVDGGLITFINRFFSDYCIPLDPVYTGKMIFGVIDGIRTGYFQPGSTVLVIHTGGLQGIEGMNELLRQKQKPTINIHG